MKTDREKLGHVFRQQIIRADCYGVRQVQDAHTILDIGGNMGMFSILCRCLFPNARIITVEACPDTCERLEWNTRFFDIEVHNVALSLVPQVEIYRGGDSGSNSTKPAEGQGIRGMRLTEMLSEWHVDFDHPTILKCDCEGGERAIIDDRTESRALMGFRHLAFEMHYSDGKGQAKWANAVRRRQGEGWIDRMIHAYGACHSSWVYHQYKPDRLGGMLVMGAGSD